MIDDCVAGLAAIGVLPRCAGLITGYLGKAEIGEAALRALAAVRAANPERRLRLRSGDRRCRPRRLCRAGRRRILPRPRPARRDHRHAERLRARMADRRAARTLDRGPRGRRGAARARARVSPSSLRSRSRTRQPDRDRHARRRRSGLWRLATPKLPIAVNGAGDLFAALFFHHWLERRSTPEALSRTASSVFGIVAATFAAGERELALIAAQDELVRPSQVFTAEAVYFYQAGRTLLSSAASTFRAPSQNRPRFGVGCGAERNGP